MGHSDKTDPGLIPAGYIPVRPKQRMGVGAKLALGCAGFWGLIALIGAIVAVTGADIRSSSPVAPVQAAPAVVQPAPPDPFASMTPAQHLEALSSLLRLEDIHDADMAAAQKHLMAIPGKTPESAKARGLLAQLERKQAAQKLVRDIAARKAYASTLENNMLDRGVNMTITAIGKGATTLRLEYVLTSKVAAHALGKNDQFWTEVRGFGFKKVLMTNGFESSLGETWTWKVN